VQDDDSDYFTPTGSDEDDSDNNDSDDDNLPPRINLEDIFLERLRFGQAKPRTVRRILEVALNGMKTVVESHLHPNSRDDRDEIILKAAELLKKKRWNIRDKAP
jgi:hypothetical protein